VATDLNVGGRRLSAEDVEELFGLHEEEDFARPGQVATQTVTMPMGPVTVRLFLSLSPSLSCLSARMAWSRERAHPSHVKDERVRHGAPLSLSAA
jgi:hypothetical protein